MHTIARLAGLKAMKHFIFILPFLLNACKSKFVNTQAGKTDTSISQQPVVFAINELYDTTGQVIIVSKYFDDTDSLMVPLQKLKEITEQFPTLNEAVPQDPDISFSKSGYYRDFIDTTGKKKRLSFGSEVGQDHYYMLYAYFLQQRNRGEELKNRSKNLTKIYNNINYIFSILNKGGTFFGHQYRRINAYVAYEVYQYNENKAQFEPGKNITAPKEKYLKLLKDNIVIKTNLDNELSDESARKKQQRELFKYVKDLDTLISDNFYLTNAEAFQYANY